VKRYVTATRKDVNGDITALCNSDASWSPREKWLAISDIENGVHEYWVPWSNVPHTKIHVVSGRNGKYLRTGSDFTTSNNLDDLPDC